MSRPRLFPRVPGAALACLFLGAAARSRADLRPLDAGDLLPLAKESPLLERIFSSAEMAEIKNKLEKPRLGFSYRVCLALGTDFASLAPSQKIAAARLALDRSLGADAGAKAYALSAETGLAQALARRIFDSPLSSFFNPSSFGSLLQKEEEGKARRGALYAEGLGALKRGDAVSGARSLLQAAAVDLAAQDPASVSPQDGDLYYALGLAYLNQGDAPHAGAAFKAGLVSQAEHAGCSAGLARVSPQGQAEAEKARLDKASKEKTALQSRAESGLDRAYKAEIGRHKSSRRKMFLFGAAGAAILISGMADRASQDDPVPGDSEERLLELSRRKSGSEALMGLGGGIIFLAAGGAFYYQGRIWGTQRPEAFLASNPGFPRPPSPSAGRGLSLELASLRF